MVFLMKILLMGSLNISLLHAAGMGENWENLGEFDCPFHNLLVGEWEFQNPNTGVSISYKIGSDLSWHSESRRTVNTEDESSFICIARVSGVINSCMESPMGSAYSFNLEDRTKKVELLVEHLIIEVVNRESVFPVRDECLKYYFTENTAYDHVDYMRIRENNSVPLPEVVMKDGLDDSFILQTISLDVDNDKMVTSTDEPREFNRVK
ncbi:MAG: hypothetical protein OXB84_03960 [Halobacteriovoraceae bacterium]|nr:hypothetical protein [Halobacteriovoraceae bacterium]